jgi:ketosteroid isomerase-like protein
MRTTMVSRRTALKVGPYAITAAAVVPTLSDARTQSGLSPSSEEAIRKYYAAWETKDWRPFERLLADNFTFTSPNDDDHIGKGAFKTRCWESQIDFIERFDLQRVFGSGNEAFVMYVCRTKNGNTFRNVDYIRLRDDQLEAIECYFGAKSSFASAVGNG